MTTPTPQLPPEFARVHMVGIGGAGMSGIARILLDRGALVSGSDAKESRGVLALRARGALINIGHDASALDLLPGDDPLAADARHNLELAKLLWLRAREAEKARSRPSDLPPDLLPEPPRHPEMGGSEDPGGTEASVGGPDPGGTAAGPGPAGAGRKTPGAGNLPVLQDGDQAQPLSPQDARAHLRVLADRLASDRHKSARLLVGPERPNVRDW